MNKSQWTKGSYPSKDVLHVSSWSFTKIFLEEGAPETKKRERNCVHQFEDVPYSWRSYGAFCTTWDCMRLESFTYPYSYTWKEPHLHFWPPELLVFQEENWLSWLSFKKSYIKKKKGEWASYHNLSAPWKSSHELHYPLPTSNKRIGIESKTCWICN